MQLARVGAVLGVAAAVVTTGLLTALPASAHNKAFKAKCEDGKAVLSVNLTQYAPKTDDKTNYLKITLDGQHFKIIEFGDKLVEKYSAEVDLTVQHKFAAEVDAYDGHKGKQFDHKTDPDDKNMIVEPCPEQVPPVEEPPAEQPPAEEPPAEQPPAEEPPAEEPPAEEPPAEETTPVTTTEVAPTTTTTAAVVPVAEKDELASTGASIAIPLGIGVVLLGGGAGLLFFLRRRASNS
ncbi:LPXTG cell wall anchor domain-containing protein [Saccharothrix longispora]|uniref:LPXTG cell wall anchor domain-containing protein n=1 Tax=Saccharothrix longispora TaxID=33920 RepID=UPI0028FD26B9|nr:LPXTG cell wall anchor domain-containing protein [Saccharothrix longispora]MDU0292906.1 LPXTG cell wall anchor domain-containing protein [Saccharothrix longispora]